MKSGDARVALIGFPSVGKVRYTLNKHCPKFITSQHLWLVFHVCVNILLHGLLIGFMSLFQSTLLNVLTSTHSESANYEFTTLTCIPGVIEVRLHHISINSNSMLDCTYKNVNIIIHLNTVQRSKYPVVRLTRNY